MDDNAFKGLHTFLSSIKDNAKYKFHKNRVDMQRIYLAMPSFLLNILGTHHEFSGDAIVYNGTLYFQGVRVIPNYEMEVVLFHEDYLYNDKDIRYIYKVPLNPLYHKANPSGLQESIFLIQELIPKTSWAQEPVN